MISASLLFSFAIDCIIVNSVFVDVVVNGGVFVDGFNVIVVERINIIAINGTKG